jgi:uncharacterized membrane protein
VGLPAARGPAQTTHFQVNSPWEGNHGLQNVDEERGKWLVMTDKDRPPSAFADSPSPAPASLSEHIDQNIESVVAHKRREWEQTGASQRRVERVSRFIGRPGYLIGALGVVMVWVGLNLAGALLGLTPPDPPPFAMLQGFLTLLALITTTIVLIAQNRQMKLEQQQAQLQLQVNLLTEQKVTKLIRLIEELRRDLPMVKDRHDPQAAVLQEPADATQVLSALEEGGLTPDSE